MFVLKPNYLKPEDYTNDEWGAFGQMAWLDKRTTSGTWRVSKDFPGLPTWLVKAVGAFLHMGRSYAKISRI